MSRSITLASNELVVEFVWQHDRYANRISLADGEAIIPLLESREGTSDDAWPASPPLQDAHLEQRDDGQVAMLVGQAGKSHWSLSCETSRKDLIVQADGATSSPESGERAAWGGAFRLCGSVVFDVACRYKLPPEELKSSYRVLAPASFAHTEEGGIEFKLPNSLFRLRLETASPCVVSADPPSGAWSVVATQLQAPPATARWTYSITLFSDKEHCVS